MTTKIPFFNPSAKALCLITAMGAVFTGYYSSKPELTHGEPNWQAIAKAPSFISVQSTHVIGQTGKALIWMDGFAINLDFDFQSFDQAISTGVVADLDITSLTVTRIVALSTGHEFNDFTTRQDRQKIADSIKSSLLASKFAGGAQ